MTIYWEYILISAAFLYAVWNIFRQLRKIRYDFFHKTAVKNILRKIEADRSAMYFNSMVLRQILIFLYRQKNKAARRAFLNLICGKTAPATAYMERHKQSFYGAVLEAFTKPKTAAAKLKALNMPGAEVELAVLLFSCGQLPEVEEILAKIPDSALSAYEKARKRYCQSYLFLNDGDMLSASQCAAEAGKLFNKGKVYFEEAQSYLLNGTIYRLSCIEDVAKFMFDAAAKIFEGFGDEAGVADTCGNRGMLWVLQEKFVEAEAEFGQALKINRELGRESGEADILNQMALTSILSKNYAAASHQLSQSGEIHQRRKDLRGLAFGAELSAHLYYEQKDFAKAAACAEEAQRAYEKAGNLSAYFESLYLQALAEFEGGNLIKAEKLLRPLLHKAKTNKSSFHLASAYNLMGLVFLKNGKAKEAKVWFQEAAKLEQKNDRYSGAAADYANIGLIEKRCGNLVQARKNLETAIEFAEVYGKTELSENLRKKLKKLKV